MGFTTGFVNRLVTWVPIFWEERLQQPNIWKFTRGFHRLWSMPILSMGLGECHLDRKRAVDMSSASLASSENSDIIALTFLRGPTTARALLSYCRSNSLVGRFAEKMSRTLKALPASGFGLRSTSFLINPWYALLTASSALKPSIKGANRSEYSISVVLRSPTMVVESVAPSDQICHGSVRRNWDRFGPCALW